MLTLRSSLFELLVTPLLYLFAVAVVCVGVESEGRGQARDSSNELAQFQQQLERRVSKDQAARRVLNRHYLREPKKGDREAFDRKTKKLLKKASETDAQNLQWLKNEIDRNGIPKYPVLGVRSAEHFFLLVLHADRAPEFQLSCLEGLKSEITQWPESFPQLLEQRLNLVNPDVFTERQDDPPKTEQPK